MRRIRISLRSLILIVTAFTVFLGYSQYRRTQILNVCAELQAEGYVFQIPDAWHDRLWQRKPVVGTVFTVNEKERMSRSRRLHEGGTLLSPTSEQQEIERFKKLGMVKYRVLTPRQERVAEQLDEIRERLKKRGYEDQVRSD
jgi:hypothetical protein